MAKTQQPNEEDKIVKAIIQRRFKDMFSGKNEPLSNLSLREVEALKTRIADLEAELEGHRKAGEASMEPASQPSKAKPIDKVLTRLESPAVETKGKKPRAARSLTLTLTIFLAVFSIVTLIVAQSSQFILSRRNLNSSIANQQQLLAQEAGTTVASSIQEKFSVLETAVEFGDPGTTSSASRQILLDNLLGLQPAFRQLAFLGPTGRQLATVSRQSSSLSQQFVSQLEGDTLAQTQEGQRYVSPVYIDQLTSEPLVAIAVPARNVFGDFQGALVAELNLKFMWDLVDRLQVGETGYAYVVDNQGNLIAFGDIARVLRGENAGHISQVSEFLANPSASTDVDPQVTTYRGLVGEEVVGTYLPLGTPQWAVVVEIPAEEAFRPSVVQRNVSLITALVIAILAAVIGRYIARRIGAPLTDLSSVATEIAGGNLAKEAKVAGPAEVAQVATTFNRMTGQLRELIATLERRVADRTHDLELAAEVGRTVTEKVTQFSEMLAQAAETIRSRFDLYYTQIYLTDPSGEKLILRAGTGEAGKELLQRGHFLLANTSSLNGRAVVEKQAQIVADTKDNPSFLPNPLLPNTRSEMSVPLIVGGNVVGVLDMQSEQPGALSEMNLPAFEALAGQLAVAIRNAALFAEVQEARSEVEAQVQRFTEQGWQDFLDAIQQGQRIGFAFDDSKIRRLKVDALSKDSETEHFKLPITVTGVKVGEIQLPPGLKTHELELVKSVGNQLAQHVENLRLLAQAEMFRNEAELALRRLTHEGWATYLSSTNQGDTGYIYDLNQVQPIAEQGSGSGNGHLKRPLVVRDETIGELKLDVQESSEEAIEVISAVAQQLSGHLENLRLVEQNEKRAYELATVATVSTTASTLLDPDQLLQSVVDLTKERFGLYHVHVYVYEEAWSTLLLAAGAGEVGRKLVAEQHAIPMSIEHSLVARAARARQAVIVNDVASEPGFLPNPLLPQTCAEMAVPMTVGDKLLGVFDVQSNNAAGFSDEDANIYVTLASQVGVALQNARLYVEQAALVTQLRELDRLKSSFLANMSHELRTPLNSILGFADVIIEELDGPLTENMANDLRLIQKNGQHLLHLINDVLDMAKIEAGRMNLNPETFKACEVMEEVTSITSTLASEKNLALFIEADSDWDVKIYADRTRLRQVMINLVNNAIKFTENGKIAIKVAQLQGARILISVKDTGIGIPPDKLDAIFQEFTQVDSSSTRKAGGTGLGLPISRKLVEMHGGRLWAESTGVPGEGSTFFVELPVEARITETVEKQAK